MADKSTPNGKEKSKHTIGAAELIESLKRNDIGEYTECMEIYFQKYKEFENGNSKETKKRKAADVNFIEKRPPHNPPA